MAEADKKLWHLARINLFRDLPADTMQKIAQTSQMRNYEKGFYISTPSDDTDERIYFVKEGEAEIYEVGSGGKKIIINILQPGDIFGYASMESASAPHQFMKARSNAVMCTMPKSRFLALLEQNPELALRVIKELSLQLSATESRLRDTALSDMETRVLRELKRLEDAGKLARKFTHEELAQLVGTTRETITRTLTRLTTKKRLSVDSEGRFILRGNSPPRVQ